MNKEFIEEFFLKHGVTPAEVLNRPADDVDNMSDEELTKYCSALLELSDKYIEPRVHDALAERDERGLLKRRGISEDETVYCNFCGKEFNEWDKQEDFGFNYMVGYGSTFDMTELELHLCCDCFDKTMNEYIIPHCKINPIIDEDTFPRMRFI